MPVFTLSYRSRNLIEDLTMDSSAALESLLKQSRARNAAAGVTGALLFNEGGFVQVLEGGEAEVRGIYASIARDPRHTDILLMTAGPAPRRHFERWSMAFVGTSRGARDYYRRFAVEDAVERTRASADALFALLAKLMAIDDAAADRGNGA